MIRDLYGVRLARADAHQRAVGLRRILQLVLPLQERLFGAGGTGRLSHGSRGVKLEKLRGDGYDPRDDTCLVAFIRLLEAAAESHESPESSVPV